MGSKKEFNFDDFEIDDFDFDDSFNEPSKSTGARKAVEDVAAGSYQGFKSAVGDKSFHINILRRALPEGYSAAYDVVQDISEKGTGLYNEVMKDLQPAVNDMKRIGRRANKLLSSVLPDKVTQRIDEMLKDKEEEMSSSMSQDEIRNQSIAAELGPIFQAQEAERQQDKSDRLVKDLVDTKRHIDNKDISVNQLNELRRLTTYQDNITAGYQRKSLELKYRHMFIARDHFELFKASTEEILGHFRAISKNTSLPDVVKMQNSELALQIAKERLIGKAQDKIAPVARDFLNAFSKNLGGRLKEKVGEFKDAVSTASFAGDMVDSIDPEAMGMSKTQMGATMGAETLTRKAGEWLGGKLNPYIAKNDKVRGISNKLLFGAENYNKVIKSYLEEASFSSGFLTMLQDSALEALRLRRESKVGYDHISNSTEAATFDNLTRKSIIEVIPGWLSKLYHAFTGKKDNEITFDHLKNDFVKTDDVVADINAAAYGNSEISRLKEINSELIGKLSDGDSIKDLSKSLETLFLKIARNDIEFTPKKLVDGDYQRMSGLTPSEYDRLVETVLDTFSTDFEGNIENDNIKGSNLLVEINRDLKRLRENMPNAYEVANLYANTGNREAVRRTGLVTNINGEDHIDEESFYRRYENFEEDSIKAKAKEATRNNVSDNGYVNRINHNTSGTFDSSAFGDMVASIDALTREIRENQLRSDSLIKDELFDPLAKELTAQNQLDILREIKEVLTLLPEQISIVNNHYENGGDEESWRAKFEAYYTGKKEALSGTLNGSAKDFFKDKYRRFIKRPIVAAKNLTLGSLNFTNKTLRSGFGLATSLFNSVTGRNKTFDVYVKGQMETPILYKTGFDSGQYKDAISGDLIKVPKNIKGAVKDIDGNIVLKIEDFEKGLVDINGKPVHTSLFKGALNLISKVSIPSYIYNPLKFAQIVKDTVLNRIDMLPDVYVEGESKPRLYARLIKLGRYYNESGKVVKRLKDIDSPIRDANNEIVIKEDELGKLVDFQGKPLKSIYGKASDLAIRTGKFIKDKTVATAKWLWKKGEEVSKLVGDKFSTTVTSVKEKISGSSLPKATKDKMLNRIYKLLVGYFRFNGYEHDSTYNPFFKNTKGDSDDSSITDKFDTLRDRTENFKTKAKDTFSNAKRKVSESSLFKKMSDRFSRENSEKGNGSIKDKFTSGYTSFTDKIKNKKKQLEEREGSWYNILKERKEKAKNKITDVFPKKESEKKSSSNWGWLLTAITALGSTVWKGLKWLGGIFMASKAMDAGTDALGSIADALPGGPDGPDKPNGKKPPKTPKAGGGFWSKVKNFVKPSNIVSAATTAFTAARGYMTLAGLGGLGAGALGILTNPFVLGGAAVATVGYFAYKWAVESMDLFTEFRMLQYGVPELDYSLCKRVAALEKLLDDKIIYEDNSAQLKGQTDFKEILEMFDMQINEKARIKAFNIWFMERFRPVYLTHKSLLKAMADETDLDKTESVLKENKDKRVFAEATLFRGVQTPYNISASPFADERNMIVGNKEIMAKYAEIKDEYGGDTSNHDSALAMSSKLLGKELPIRKDMIVTEKDIQVVKDMEQYKKSIVKTHVERKEVLGQNVNLAASVDKQAIYTPKGNNPTEMIKLIESAADAAGVDPVKLVKIASEITGLDNDSIVGARKGLFLMDSATFNRAMTPTVMERYGIDNPNMMDPEHSAIAMAEWFKKNGPVLNQLLEREATEQELYASMLYKPEGVAKLRKAKVVNNVSDYITPVTLSDKHRLKEVKDVNDFFDNLFKRVRSTEYRDPMAVKSDTDTATVTKDISVPVRAKQIEIIKPAQQTNVMRTVGTPTTNATRIAGEDATVTKRVTEANNDQLVGHLRNIDKTSSRQTDAIVNNLSNNSTSVDKQTQAILDLVKVLKTKKEDNKQDTSLQEAIVKLTETLEKVNVANSQPESKIASNGPGMGNEFSRSKINLG